MKDIRLFTTSAACALGAAMLVTTALQSTPAEAREKGSGHTDSAHVKVKQGHAVPPGFHGGKQPHAVPSGFHGGGKQVTSSVGGTRATSSNGTKQPGDGASFTPVGLPGGIKAADFQSGGTKATSSGNGGSRPTLGNGGDLIPVPIQSQSGSIKATSSQSGGTKATSSSSGQGGTIQVQPQSGGKLPPISATPTTPAPNPPLSTSSNNSGGGKLPPVITATPTSIPPATGPIIASNFPGGVRPPVIVATPIPTPIPPATGPINPGNYPGTPPISTVPTPTPIPVPIPTGSSPNPGHGTGYTHQPGQHGVYAEIGAGGGGYDQCAWFKSNYDRTGNAYWLNRYRVCLWQH